MIDWTNLASHRGLYKVVKKKDMIQHDLQPFLARIYETFYEWHKHCSYSRAFIHIYLFKVVSQHTHEARHTWNGNLAQKSFEPRHLYVAIAIMKVIDHKTDDQSRKSMVSSICDTPSPLAQDFKHQHLTLAQKVSQNYYFGAVEIIELQMDDT